MANLSLDKVFLEYPIYERLRLFGQRGSSNNGFLALKGISIDLENGDRVAILGKNGAGKTTLLRVMAGIYTPTKGEVSAEGRISSMLTIGIGMNPEADAYENIINCGLMLGLKKNYIEDVVIPDIEQFSELGEFMSKPVRMYSRGMQTRLSFGISTAINPEILIMDEMIGAGDKFFVEKAKQRMAKILEASSIVVLASHNLTIVEDICNKGCVLEQGELVYFGTLAEAIELYKGG